VWNNAVRRRSFTLFITEVPTAKAWWSTGYSIIHNRKVEGSNIVHGYFATPFSKKFDLAMLTMAQGARHGCLASCLWQKKHNYVKKSIIM